MHSYEHNALVVMLTAKVCKTASQFGATSPKRICRGALDHVWGSWTTGGGQVDKGSTGAKKEESCKKMVRGKPRGLRRWTELSKELVRER